MMQAHFTRIRKLFPSLLAILAVAGSLQFSATLAADPIVYSVSVVGTVNADLKDALLKTSQLLPDADRPVATIRGLRRRVEAAKPRIDALLRARGYYAATHSFDIARPAEGEAAIAIRVETGPPYRIGRYDVRVVTPGEPRKALSIPFGEIGVAPGDVALAEKVAAADGRLLATFGRQGYPLAKIAERRLVVDHEARTLSAEVDIDSGLYTRFGALQVKGLKTVDTDLVARHVAWKRGAEFDTEALDGLRKKLRRTGLFSSVRVKHTGQTGADGTLDVTVEVTERKHRSIGVGASYSTTEGALGKVFWEHRNLWGDGEQLRLRAEVGEIRQGLFGDLRLNDFPMTDQNLVFEARGTREQREGFESTEASGLTRLERQFSDIYAGSVGMGLDWSQVEENGVEETFTFLTVPLTAKRDTSDSLLDPGRGGRDTLTVTPHFGILDTDETFVAGRLFDTRYLSLLPEKKLVLAGWVRLGTIVGEETAEIPANKRLYAGGPGSVRGYALDTVGPLDSQNDPIGGRSSTEFGIELRWRITGPFGAVAFVESGGVYDGSVPDWGDELLWGAGAGVRYITAIGPIRFDVAVPLNRRNDVDDSFQVLVSLGQAF